MMILNFWCQIIKCRYDLRIRIFHQVSNNQSSGQCITKTTIVSDVLTLYFSNFVKAQILIALIASFVLGYLFTGDSLDRQVDHGIYRLIWVIPHICHGSHGYTRVNFFLAGVNFYRFNAKNWHFRQILREKVAFFTDLTQKIGVFRCKFYSPKILPV